MSDIPTQRMRDAQYVIECRGDGSRAYLVTGWDAMVDAVASEHFAPADADDRATVLGWLTNPDMWDAWAHDGDHFVWSIEHEDGAVRVIRLTA